MDRTGIIAILSGALLVSIRAPLVFIPGRFLLLAEGIIKSNRRIRLLGIFILVWGVVMVFCSQPLSGVVSWLIMFLGEVWGLSGLFLLLIFPSAYRTLVEIFLEAETGFVRLAGMIASLFGLLLIFLGIYYA